MNSDKCLCDNKTCIIAGQERAIRSSIGTIQGTNLKDVIKKAIDEVESPIYYLSKTDGTSTQYTVYRSENGDTDTSQLTGLGAWLFEHCQYYVESHLDSINVIHNYSMLSSNSGSGIINTTYCMNSWNNVYVSGVCDGKQIATSPVIFIGTFIDGVKWIRTYNSFYLLN